MRCRYCKTRAGWFSSEHPKCREISEAGLEAMRDLTAVYALQGDSSDYESKFNAIATASFNTGRIAEMRLAGLQKAFEIILSSGRYDMPLADNLREAARTLPSDEQRVQLPLRRLDMMGRLHDLSHGRETLNIDGDVLPLADPKPGEFSVWNFHSVRYFEEKTHYTYEGRSSGVSVRIAKGVSVRVGQSQGRRVEHNSLEQVDTGLLTISNRRLHFMGSRKAFKLFFEKLALIEPYTEGLKVIRDTPTAKPQISVFEDAWFVSEVLHRIS